MNKKVLILTLILLSSLGFLIHVKSNDNLKDSLVLKEEFSYKILPSDKEWASFSYVELLEMCEMPEDLLKSYPTDKLADLVLDYPFKLDFLAFDNFEYGMEQLLEKSNICREFFSREDATNILLNKYNDLKSFTKEDMNPNDEEKLLFLQCFFANQMDLDVF